MCVVDVMLMSWPKTFSNRNQEKFITVWRKKKCCKGKSFYGIGEECARVPLGFGLKPMGKFEDLETPTTPSEQTIVESVCSSASRADASARMTILHQTPSDRYIDTASVFLNAPRPVSARLNTPCTFWDFGETRYV